MAIQIAGDARAQTLYGPGQVDITAGLPETLSPFGLFTDIRQQLPVDGVVGYSVNAPLFSDYARKYRFIALPDGGQLVWHDRDGFDAPPGTIAVKTFAMPHDLGRIEAGERLLETRLLLRTETGWKPAVYIWNDQGSEAYFKPAGKRINLTFIDKQGQQRQNRYGVPNVNQCALCHQGDTEFSLLGVKARQLNGPYDRGPEDRANQLQYFVASGMVKNASTDAISWPHMMDYRDERAGSVEARARSFLDINCAHCHRIGGHADYTGFWLGRHITNPRHLGVRREIATTGRANQGRRMLVFPGHPDQSAIMARLDTDDPSVMMPMVGRNLVYDEGVALIRAWLLALEDK